MEYFMEVSKYISTYTDLYREKMKFQKYEKEKEVKKWKEKKSKK